MRHLDLFSGIGGFALAARNVGWETVGFCEIDPWCQQILAKNFPGVPIHDDVTTLHGKPGTADIITGGFPCQDISYAGKGAGIEGERSGLWTELARIIGEVRPRYAVLENVAALLSRGLDRVAGDLAEIGYDCEWHCVPASYIGAPHRRDRIWIICYPNGDGEPASAINAETSGVQGDVAYPGSKGLERRQKDLRPQKEWRGYAGHIREALGRNGRNSQWLTEPDVGRVANGVSKRVDRLRGLGNAIVPQVAELIFKAISHKIPKCPDQKAVQIE